MSLSRHSDTIVAPITAVGGAVAVVRVSGSAAWEVASRVFRDWPERPESHRAVYGTFSNGDDGVALPFAVGRSYTGEESVELSVHGSAASVRALVEACVRSGARVAEPGEFTLRAFMNGRMDLTQAEGVRDTVEAQTDAQLRQANLLREGALRNAVAEIRSKLEGVLTAVEASTDFSEEIGEMDRTSGAVMCRVASSQIDALLATEPASRLVREGATVVIAGLPNAGKSSLLNKLIGSDRAIVTDVPGTTRDTIEESLSLDGALVRLVDTAGLRESEEPVETLGVERTRQAIEGADFVLHVYDAARGWLPEDSAITCALDQPYVIVANKSDLARSEKGVAVSCATGEGVPEVIAALNGLVSALSRDSGLVNRRHAEQLREAKSALGRAVETLHSELPTDLAAVDLQSAIRSLGEITGETASSDVIERIFRDFCIGK